MCWGRAAVDFAEALLVHGAAPLLVLVQGGWRHAWLRGRGAWSLLLFAPMAVIILFVDMAVLLLVGMRGLRVTHKLLCLVLNKGVLVLGLLLLMLIVLHCHSNSHLHGALLFGRQLGQLIAKRSVNNGLQLDIDALHLLPARLPRAGAHEAVAGIHLDAEDPALAERVVANLRLARPAPVRLVRALAGGAPAICAK